MGERGLLRVPCSSWKDFYVQMMHCAVDFVCRVVCLHVEGDRPQYGSVLLIVYDLCACVDEQLQESTERILCRNL